MMKSKYLIHLVGYVKLMFGPFPVVPQELNGRNTSQTLKSKSSSGWQAYLGAFLVLEMWKCPDVFARCRPRVQRSR